MDSCFKACASSSMKPLNKDEKVCLSRCFDSRLETRSHIVETMSRMLEEEYVNQYFTIIYRFIQLTKFTLDKQYLNLYQNFE